jgi:hypothetical protein
LNVVVCAWSGDALRHNATATAATWRLIEHLLLGETRRPTNMARH